MIPIQDQRMAFKYAVAFITNEICSIEESLASGHLLKHIQVALRKRLNELKSDLEKLLKYELHD